MTDIDTGAIAPKTVTETAAPPVWAEASVTLLFPLTNADGTKITTIKLSEPNAEQLEDIEQASISEKRQTAVMRATFSILSGVPIEVLAKLNARDYMALAEAAGPLLEAMTAGAKT